MRKLTILGMLVLILSLSVFAPVSAQNYSPDFEDFECVTIGERDLDRWAELDAFTWGMAYVEQESWEDEDDDEYSFDYYETEVEEESSSNTDTEFMRARPCDEADDSDGFAISYEYREERADIDGETFRFTAFNCDGYCPSYVITDTTDEVDVDGWSIQESTYYRDTGEEFEESTCTTWGGASVWDCEDAAENTEEYDDIDEVEDEYELPDPDDWNMDWDD